MLQIISGKFFERPERYQHEGKRILFSNYYCARGIAMPRKRYSAFISALDNLEHALQVLNWNLDLAYSILVYCLESLSQTFDEYTANWADYDESVRSDLDELLSTVAPDAAARI